MPQNKGLTTFNALILSAPRPSQRVRNGKAARMVETVKFVTDDGKTGVYEQPIDEDPIAKGTVVEIKGYGTEREWQAEASGRTGSTLYIADVLEITKANIPLEAWEMKRVSDFTQTLGAAPAAVVAD
jgi:hypothetical protein